MSLDQLLNSFIKSVVGQDVIINHTKTEIMIGKFICAYPHLSLTDAIIEAAIEYGRFMENESIKAKLGFGEVSQLE